MLSDIALMFGASMLGAGTAREPASRSARSGDASMPDDGRQSGPDRSLADAVGRRRIVVDPRGAAVEAALAEIVGMDDDRLVEPGRLAADTGAELAFRPFDDDDWLRCPSATSCRRAGTAGSARLRAATAW